MSVSAASPATSGPLQRRQTAAFLSLFFGPAVAQAILLTVVPLEALTLLGSPRGVTLLYVGAGLIAVVGRFSIPLLVRPIRRRFVFTLGALSLAASGVLLASDTVPTLAAGLALSTFGFACVEITSQLYLLDHIPRHALRHFEPMRIFASAGPWTLGPWLGVYLQHQVAFAAPFAIASSAALLVLVLFWWLRLGENAMLAAMRRPPPSPCTLSAPLLRATAAAACVGPRRSAVVLVEHVLRLYADLCGHDRAGRGDRRRGGFDR